MPFNSNTYYINKYRRECCEQIATGREVQRLAAIGEQPRHGPLSYDVAWYARRARHYLIMWRLERRIKALRRRTAP